MLWVSVLSIWLTAPTAAVADASPVRVFLDPPAAVLTMGDVPAFAGTVTNSGTAPLQGLIVYLSLVSLKPGKEAPVDLEDWSASGAIRIDRLLPGATTTHDWKLRLIQAGKFGVVLTVIDPHEMSPVVSSVLRFEIRPKRLLESKRILPVAIGVPALLLLLWGTAMYFANGKTFSAMSR